MLIKFHFSPDVKVIYFALGKEGRKRALNRTPREHQTSGETPKTGRKPVTLAACSLSHRLASSARDE
jgi:hypothetical protein